MHWAFTVKQKRAARGNLLEPVSRGQVKRVKGCSQLTVLTRGMARQEALQRQPLAVKRKSDERKYSPGEMRLLV